MNEILAADRRFMNEMCVAEHGRVAYVALQDAGCRARVAGALAQLGWTVITQPTGFHLIQAIAGMIEGDHRGLRPELIVPELIVIDVRSRGTAGLTIAAGLRDLGIAIPIVLVGAPGESLPVEGDDTLRMAGHAEAERVVAEVAARLQGSAGRPPQGSAGRSPSEGPTVRPS